MALTPILPKAQAPANAGGPLTQAYYDFLRDLLAKLLEVVDSGSSDAEQIAAIIARLDALENADLAVIQGLVSVQVFGSLDSGLVQVQLQNDVSAPGNTYYYGTTTDGAKGWFSVAGTLIGADSVVKSVGTDGVVTFRLDGDTAAPGSLFGYGTNMAGAKGWYRPALFESTGLLSGGTLSINAGDNTKFDVAAAVVGYTDYSTNPAQPTRTVATYGPTSANSVPSLAVIATYVGIQTPGSTLTTQSSPFTATQRRTIVPLGAVISNGTNLIAVNNLPDVMRAGINQIQDLMAAIGPMNLSGNVISANGANLNINKSSGIVFKQGSNFTNDPNNPHGLSLAGLTAASFQYRLSTGTSFATTTSVDPNNYESPLGTLAAISPANRWTIQRFTVFTSNLIRVQYGQHLYGSMAEAEAQLSTESFVTEQNIADNGILLCYLIVQQGTTDLSNTTKAKFIPASKFGGPVGTGGTSITNTDALPEGSVNLYYTDERVDDRVSALIQPAANSGITWTYNDAGGTLTPVLDATLAALVTQNWAANALPIGSGADTVSQVAFAANTFPARASTGDLVAKAITDFGLSLVDDANAAAARTTLGALSNSGDTATGTYTFDGGTVYVDSTNHRVGVGTTSPLQKIHIEDTVNIREILRNSTENTSYSCSFDFATGTGSLASTNVVARFVASITQADPSALISKFGLVINLGDNAATVIEFKPASTSPGADNTYDLGDSSFRWKSIHTSGARFDTGVVSPAQLTANTDNWSITGLSTAKVIRFSTNAALNITGIASPSNGQRITLCNIGTFNATLSHDVTSTAANRFLCPNSAALVIRPNGAVDLWYDNTSSRWRVIGI